MTGTAATMQIEENMALAARRGQRRGLRIGITKAERERYGSCCAAWTSAWRTGSPPE